MKTIKCPCDNLIKIIYKTQENRKKYCSKICFYRYRPKFKGGIKYKIKVKNSKWFKKGQIPHNKGIGKGWKDNGYIKISINGKDKKEHRRKIEDFIGRKLKLNEIIHHKDGNKSNNNIENLQIVTRAEHIRIHKIWKTKKLKVKE